MKTFTKKYQVWVCNDVSIPSYICIPCDSLEECLQVPKGNDDWYITKKVSLSIKDVEDVQAFPKTLPSHIPVKVDEETDPVSAAAEAAYLRGTTGAVS